jgi:hypothetical protein
VSDADRKKYCKSCHTKHQGKPPCVACKWKPPELLPENLDAWDLWLSVQTQWRASGFGIIGLDYLALQQEADRLEIDLSICTMAKIRALEAYTLKQQSKKNVKSDTQGS